VLLDDLEPMGIILSIDVSLPVARDCSFSLNDLPPSGTQSRLTNIKGCFGEILPESHMTYIEGTTHMMHCTWYQLQFMLRLKCGAQGVNPFLPIVTSYMKNFHPIPYINCFEGASSAF
jgi:hypothetical protein